MAAGTAIEASSDGTVYREIIEMRQPLTCRSVSPPNLEEAHGSESFCKAVCRFAAPDIHPRNHVLFWSLDDLDSLIRQGVRCRNLTSGRG
jgi:hypothetical protein